MQIRESVAVVTGANRGIGAEFVRQLLERGATTVYAGARDASAIAVDDPRVVPVTLDVTDPDQVAAVAALATDATLVVNNAGIAAPVPLVTGDLADIRSQLETNAFGPLHMARAFAPTLAAAGGGAILNVLSASSWVAFPGGTTYGVSKAAAWSLTDGLRNELAEQGTQVVALHMGLVDTDMSRSLPGDRIPVSQVVTAALDGLERGDAEVLADEPAKVAKASLALEPTARYAQLLAAFA
ncbi:SDR family oxidoreductase [Agrococcus jejuensis]|uniref:Short-chain dehydrogenase n=1 Tax=Agrococcus jejuensis TaxID=399736 RepID=A0A1G8D9P4_9MICO|nr:SDR family oxidoreductase [Agrococcus jejuensis]SDH54466.1 Short-chain dehydrogenase [Agrococcus jejuensis]